MCVGSVCTHPSYNDKNLPSVFFLNPYFKILSLKSDCSEVPARMMQFFTDRSHDSLFYKDVLP